MSNHPPKFFLKLFRWYCHPRLVDSIEGDLMELYKERAQRNGRLYANLLFIREVILLARKGIIRPLEGSYQMTSYGMVKSYVKLGSRNLFKRKSLAGIKLLGLSIGMTTFLLIQGYLSFEKSYDRFHAKHEQIHRIDYKLLHKGELLSHSATTPPTIAPFIHSNMAGINDYVRILPFPDLVIRYGNSIFREDKVLIVDPSFFQIFDFDVIEGNAKTALSERGSMMISQKMQKKYFGNSEAIGKPISIDGYKDYVVTGVFANAPDNSHLQFDFLLSFETAKWWFEGETETDWTSGEYHSYLLLDPATNLESISALLKGINQQTPQAEVDKKNEVEREYALTPITDIHLHSVLSEEIDEGSKGDGFLLQLLELVSYAILVVVWFNYVNQAAARLFVRAKEIGLRKIMGASQQNLITQFMVESFIIHLLALIIAATAVLVVHHIVKDELLLGSLDLYGQPDILIQVISVLGFGFLIATLLPVMFTISFNLGKSLSGQLKSSKKAHALRRSMVSLQVIVSMVFITCTLVIFYQLQHIRTQETGFDKEKMMVLRGPTASDKNIQLFSTQMKQNTGIKAISVGEFVPGNEKLPSAPISRTDLDKLSFVWLNSGFIGYNYFSSLGVKFLAGGDFNDQLSLENEYVILNASATQLLQFENANAAIDATLQFGSGVKTKVVGVVEDYLQNSAKVDTKPLVFWLYPEESTHILIRFTGDETSVQEQAASAYKLAFSEDPFDYVFLEDFYNEQFQADQKYGTLFLTFTSITILMACLGLYSLIYWNTLSRTKEIGIRKVLGAKVKQIVLLMSKEFLLILAVSLAIATPISYFLASNWLEYYASRISLGIEIFILSTLLTLVVVILTVGKRTYASATSNPVNALKDE